MGKLFYYGAIALLTLPLFVIGMACVAAATILITNLGQ